MGHDCRKLRADMLSVLTQRNYESPLLLAYTDFDGMLFQGGNALIEALSQETVLVRLRVWDWYLNGMPANALIDISTDEAFFKFFSADAHARPRTFAYDRVWRHCMHEHVVMLKWRGYVPIRFCDVMDAEQMVVGSLTSFIDREGAGDTPRPYPSTYCSQAATRTTPAVTRHFQSIGAFPKHCPSSKRAREDPVNVDTTHVGSQPSRARASTMTRVEVDDDYHLDVDAGVASLESRYGSTPPNNEHPDIDDGLSAPLTEHQQCSIMHKIKRRQQAERERIECYLAPDEAEILVLVQARELAHMQERRRMANETRSLLHACPTQYARTIRKHEENDRGYASMCAYGNDLLAILGPLANSLPNDSFPLKDFSQRSLACARSDSSGGDWSNKQRGLAPNYTDLMVERGLIQRPPTHIGRKANSSFRELPATDEDYARDDDQWAVWWLELGGWDEANEFDINTWTPLHHAICSTTFSWRAARAARALIELTHIMYLNLQTTGSQPPGYTCLHMACDGSDRTNRRRSIVKLLLDKSVELELEDDKRNKPLLLACGAGVPDLVGMLLDAGANTDKRNKDNKGPWEKASYHVTNVLRAKHVAEPEHVETTSGRTRWASSSRRLETFAARKTRRK